MSTVQTIYNKVAYRIFDTTSQSIGTTSNPSATEVLSWLNDGVENLVAMLAEYRSEIGKTDGKFTTVPICVISDITQANPCVVTTQEAHGLTSGDTVYINGVSGMIEVNDTTFKVLVLTTTTFSLQTNVAVPVDVDSSDYEEYEGNGIADHSPYYSDLSTDLHTPDTFGTVFYGCEQYDIRIGSWRDKSRYGLNAYGVPEIFFLDANNYIYLRPLPNEEFIVTIPYWATQTVLTAASSTMPFGGRFDQYLAEGIIQIVQNRDEYNLQVEQYWKSFLLGRAGNLIKRRRVHFQSFSA